MADLHSWSQLLERALLSAPRKARETHTLNQVILVVSLLSMVGAGWIVLSFCLFKQVRTFRHQLILGLAISDFCMAVNFLSSCAVNLSGHTLSQQPQKKFCSFNGFMTELFVVQTDYWVLVIAVCTFLILAEYKHMSKWVQEYRIILWSLPWGLSSLWAAIGLATTGYGDVGTGCWFTSDKVHLLVNFIPRWLIIIIIIALYARLYRLIYKAHKRFMSFNDDASSHSLAPGRESVSSTRRIGRPSMSMNLTSKDLEIERSGGGAVQGRTYLRGLGLVLKKMAYQMMMYPLIYVLIWTIPTTVRIYQSVTGKAAPFGIAAVDKACIVIQGFADAIIYGVNETLLSVWRERFRKSPPTALAPANINVHISAVTDMVSLSLTNDIDSNDIGIVRP